jgi:ribosomal protein S18 acetylase RimI-like enzyme
MQIERLASHQAEAYRSDLIDLLTDAVESGASVGFLPPLCDGEAADYWDTVMDALSSPYHVLLVANDDGHVIGTVQLQYAARRNGAHRAEVMKLMVHTTARRKGVGRALMIEAERVARLDARTLFILDTRSGDPSEKLYMSLGYQTAGIIPEYARSATGELHSTVIMFKHLK